MPHPLTTSLLRRWPQLLTAAAVALVLFFLLAPTLVSRSGLLQSILSQQLARRQLRMTAQEVRIGWMTPTRLQQVTVSDDAQQWQLQADRVVGTQTLWELLRTPSQLGKFSIEQPILTVSLQKPFELPEFPEEPPQPLGTPRETAVQIELIGGQVLVLLPEQAEAATLARDIHVDAVWQQDADGKRLTVQPGRLLNRAQLTPEMCHLGLKFIAPILADVAWTKGDVSLELDQCVIRVDTPATSEVVGRVTLDSVETGLRNPLVRSIAEAVTTVTQRSLPEAVKIADNSVIAFTVADGRVAHSGLAFGLPEISPELLIRTEGTVGFDKTLDLQASIPLPLELLRESKLAQALGNQTLLLPIRGTLEQPEVTFAGDGQLVSEVLSRVLAPVAEGDVSIEEVTDALREFRQRNQERREERGPLFPRLRERLRGGR